MYQIYADQSKSKSHALGKVPYPFITRNGFSLLLILLGLGYGAASGYANPEEIPSSSYAYAGARRLLEAGSAWPWTGILNRL